jgi:Kef-type K+ transport system membrane component KefB
MENFLPGTIIVTLGIALFVGFFAKRLVNKFKIPDVTGYVVLGVLSGFFVFQRIPGLLDSMGIISDLALAIIAFIIGHELKGSVIRQLGKSIFFIVVCEAFLAFILVFCSLYFFKILPLHSALLLGAIASATAPAATVFVIHQYKSQGPLTSTIMAVVGIDDAIALIIYVFAANLAGNVFTDSKFSILIFISPVISILLSLLLGVMAGVIFKLLFQHVRNSDQMSMGICAFLLLVMGGAEFMHYSELLAVMSFSAFITNSSPVLARRSGDIIEKFTPIMLPLFFIFAGAHLDLSQISSILLICVVYTVARATGKIGGASLGAFLGKAPLTVKKFTGLGLIPQIGVAVALALAVKRDFGDPNGLYGQPGADMAIMIINVLLSTTIITETVGPLLTRYALIKSGEAQLK